MGRKRKRKPHFFKILLGNFYERLRIPPSFMKHIIVETSESASLEGPGGSIWDVKLDRAAKETYFCEGHDVLSSKPNGFQQMKTELVDMPSSRTDSCRRGHMSARRPVTKEEKTRAWTAAISFKPNYPHFVTEMKVSNVYRRFILHIPRSFSKEHLPKEKTMLTLYDPRGKAWTVSYTAGRNGRDAITGGWTAFSRDNDLQVGDVCVFELFGNKEMYVNIFRVVPEFIPQKKESET